MAIYLKLDKPPESIEGLLRSLFNSFGDGNWIKGVATYKEPECINIQCSYNKLRSIDEVIELVKTYFPDAAIKEILFYIIIMIFVRNNKVHYLYVSNCCTIYKSVIGYYNNYDYIQSKYISNMKNTTGFTANCEINWVDAYRIMELTHEQVARLVLDCYNETKDKLDSTIVEKEK